MTSIIYANIDIYVNRRYPDMFSELKEIEGYWVDAMTYRFFGYEKNTILVVFNAYSREIKGTYGIRFKSIFFVKEFIRKYVRGKESIEIDYNTRKIKTKIQGVVRYEG